MKEAMGGTWLFGIVITFIVFFTTYISVSTNYAKSFKVKDEILVTIEHYKGVNEQSISRINKYLNDIGYFSSGKCNSDEGDFASSVRDYSKWLGFATNNSSSVGSVNNANYCIRRYVISETTAAGSTGPIGHPSSAYYQVAVFFRLDWPIFRTIFNIRVEGETSIIHQYNDTFTFS